MDDGEQGNNASCTYTHLSATIHGLLPAGRSSADLICAGGPVMAKARTDSVPVSADAVIDSLRNQGLGFRGPFRTAGKRTVFVSERAILLEPYLVARFRQNQLK